MKKTDVIPDSELDASIIEPEDNPIWGDVDDDGKVTANDALCVLKHVAGIFTFDTTKTEVSDTDSDGKITANDALLILKYVAGIIE